MSPTVTPPTRAPLLANLDDNLTQMLRAAIIASLQFLAEWLLSLLK